MPKTKAPGNIIVGWIGSNDVRRMNAWRNMQGLEVELKKHFNPNMDGVEVVGHNGPFRTLSDELDAETVYILVSEEFKDVAEQFREWVQRGTKARCETIQTGVANPTSYEEIYEAAEDFFAKHWDSSRASLFNFNLTPGTPAMMAIMLYLSQVRYAGGKAWRVIEPQFVGEDGKRIFEVRLPFRIPIEIFDQESSPILADESSLEEAMCVFAPNPSVSFLLLGESGVGKTRYAKELHRACGGNKDNFQELNCAELATNSTMFRSSLFGHTKGAFTDAHEAKVGAFKLAENGTLFLDEIGEIPLAEQAILLRALQDKEVQRVGATAKEPVRNVRIVAATNKDLVEAVRKGEFREDLYFRIAMYVLKLSPLRTIIRENPDKFRRIVRDVLNGLGTEAPDLKAEWELDEAGWQVLESYLWPGNIRELRQVLLLSCISARRKSSNTLFAEDIKRHLARFRPMGEMLAEKKGLRAEGGQGGSDTVSFPMDLNAWLNDREKEIIEKAMRQADGNIAKAAELLGMDYNNLYYRLNRDNKKEERAQEQKGRKARSRQEQKPKEEPGAE